MTRRLQLMALAALAASQSISWAGEEPAAPARTTVSSERAVVDALRANPLILPYSVRVTTGPSGEIILSGKVGTKAVHDMVVRTVIDLGLVPHDDLTIDTSEATRVAVESSYAAGPAASSAGIGSMFGPAPYFVYPEPLFGRVDDPFWGFEPPILSIPPSYARRSEVPPTASSRPAPTPDERLRRASAPVKGQLQLTVDEFGQVFLSGNVASEEDKRAIEQEAMRAPGVTRVSSELKVVSRNRATPPPPPQPYDGRPIELQPATPPPAADAARLKAVPAPAPEAASAAGRRAEAALARRPALQGMKIDVESRGEVATIRGRVPSAYEDMIAFRAVERTPGVREVVDELEFPLPDENNPNPLKSKGRPEDLEPYFLYHIRRHIGDSAHIDRVRVQGDLVQVQGSPPPGEDASRLEALLRSIPLLRDFRIESDFTSD